jgi:phenylacetate-CoA ligase
MRAMDQLQVAVRLVAAMRSQSWSAKRIRDYQENALIRMMRHAATNVPFYQRLDLRAETIASAADLARFPVIGKRQVQRDPEAFMSAGFAPAGLYASRTSGSSGQPTTTYFDRDAWLLTKYALKMRRIGATAGLPVLRRVMIISEQPPEQLGSIAEAAPSGLGVFFQQRRLSIHSPIELHLTALARYRPHIVYAFPSYLLDLIATAERRAIPLPKIATLYTSSEVLTPAARRRIETAFYGHVYDVYGSTEFKEVAWQCGGGRYHLNFESVYVEAPQQGTSGPVVLSTLCNVAMPLLRFDIGDRAVFGSNACPCGRASPHMIEFVGREGDMITLPSRRRLSPYLLTTAIESEHSILQYRIVQTDTDTFRINVIVRSPGESAAWRSRMCEELERVVGEPVRLEVREVDALERDPSGKRSVFVRTPAASN